MRILRLILLGVLAYVVAMVAFFPAAPVVDRIRPQLGAVALEGVSGKLYSGKVNTVRSTDDLLPLEFSNVAWRLSPSSLLKGGAGAVISFDGYGGGGEGNVTRRWNGDIAVSDFKFNASAKELEPLLPVPVASFSGRLNGEFARITLQNNLLTALEGSLSWSDAVLATAAFGPQLSASLGKIDINVAPEGDESHVALVAAAGGDVAIDGKVSFARNGDYSTDLVLTPASSAPPQLLNVLKRIGRPDAQGQYRIKQSGNVNRMM
ncbi:MAG: type II secretion system protein N [Granulosicoccus sp.]